MDRNAWTLKNENFEIRKSCLESWRNRIKPTACGSTNMEPSNVQYFICNLLLPYVLSQIKTYLNPPIR